MSVKGFLTVYKNVIEIQNVIDFFGLAHHSIFFNSLNSLF